jgi:hypothetical protein
MASIKTADAAAALRQIIRERVDAVRGGNVVISKDEARGLDPFLRKADDALRAEGGSGTRVNADALVEKAAQRAQATWAQFNPPGTRDGVFLAQNEVASIRAADPALGALTDLALMRVRGRVDPPADIGAVVRAFFDAVDLSGRPLAFAGFVPVDARVGQAVRASVPAPVRDAFDFFHRVEDKDVGSVRLHKGTVGGQPVWAIATTTDGDDAYLEVRKDDGTLVAGLRMPAPGVRAWDDFPGRVRLSKLFVDGLDRNVAPEDGLSEIIERAAAGQPPNDWPGAVQLTAGFVHLTPLTAAPGGQGMPSGGHFLGVDLPAGITPEHRDVAVAAFEVLWDGLKPRLGPGDAFELGARREGTMVVGEFTRPTDGKPYLVADWRDIDDGSYVLYFERSLQGLKLATRQFDN